MLADGFGPTSITLARLVYQSEKGFQKEPNFQLPLDRILKGTIRTISGDSLITDSGAGATAYSCGKKGYNGGIGVDIDANPIGTLIEAAHLEGMSTGIIVTNKVTDATPASFRTHNWTRENENEIAASMIGLDHLLGEPQVDLLLGGGLSHFIPEGKTIRLENGGEVVSCRNDSRDVFWEAKKKFSFKSILTKKEFDSWNPEKETTEGTERVVGLMAGKQLAYEIDREKSGNEPSLREMTQKGIGFLHKRASLNGKGFLLLVEGSRIDVAAHSNDSATHYREIIAYNEAVQEAMNFVQQYPQTTTLISLADHETGGLTLGIQHSHEDYPSYMWNPEVLWKVQHSSFYLSHAIAKQLGEITGQDTSAAYLRQTIFNEQLGIPQPNETEIELIQRAPTPLAREFILNKIVNTRARIGWTTHGHSGVDVNLYATGRGSEEFVGNWENIQICGKIEKLLGLKVDKVTEKLQRVKK